MKKIATILILLFSISTVLFSQNCNNYHKKFTSDCRGAGDKEWIYYSQSKSALVEKDRAVTLRVIFYGDNEYSLSLCTVSNLYPIHFKLIDVETKEVLFDNSTDDYINIVQFGVENTKSMDIEITAIGKLDLDETIESRIGCLGVLIMWRNAPDIGF